VATLHHAGLEDDWATGTKPAPHQDGVKAMNRAKVDTQRDERAKRESQIVIDAERSAREQKTARLKALRLAAQQADEPLSVSPKPARRHTKA
jgi:hypothetical protein